MRIAVWHNLPTGGGKRALRYQVEELGRRGHEIKAWCPSSAYSSFCPLSDVIEERVLPLNPSHDSIRSLMIAACQKVSSGLSLQLRMNLHYRACADEIKSYKPDIFMAGPCRYYRTSPFGKLLKIPNIIYLQEPNRPFYEYWPSRRMDIPFRYIQEVRNLLPKYRERSWATSYSEILCNSFFSRESIIRAYGCEAEVSYLGVDTEQFKPSLEKRDNFILGVGYGHHIKGVDRAIDAVAALPNALRRPLVWVSDGCDESYMFQMEKRAMKLEVEFERKTLIKDEELIDLYNRAALLLYTSRLEPFGYAPVEAAACCTPIVAIAEGGVRETLEHGRSALLSSSAKPTELSENIALILNDGSLAKDLGANARETVKAKFSLQAMGDKLERHFQRIVKEASSGQ